MLLHLFPPVDFLLTVGVVKVLHPESEILDHGLLGAKVAAGGGVVVVGCPGVDALLKVPV